MTSLRRSPPARSNPGAIQEAVPQQSLRQFANGAQPGPNKVPPPPAARPTELPPGGQRVADAGAEAPLAHNAEAAEEATPTDKLFKRLAELDVSEEQYKGKGEAFPAHLGYEKKAIESAFNAALDDGDPVAVIKRHLGIDGLSGDAKAHLQKTLDELFGNNAARGRQGLAPQDAGYRQAAAPQQPGPNKVPPPPAARPTELPPGGQRVAGAGRRAPSPTTRRRSRKQRQIGRGIESLS